jgi:hypothetical protein
MAIYEKLLNLIMFFSLHSVDGVLCLRKSSGVPPEGINILYI